MKCLNLDRIDIRIVAQGFEIKSKWPTARITVDGNCVYDGPIDERKEVHYQSQALPGQKSCVIDIEYYGKVDLDNELDADGNLVKTQSLSLKEIWINDVNIIKTGAIYQDVGYYRMHLTDAQIEYFKGKGKLLGDSLSIHMFENGVWHLDIELPLLSTLSKKNAVVEKWEDVDIRPMLEELLQRIDVCKKLEKAGKIA